MLITTALLISPLTAPLTLPLAAPIDAPLTVSPTEPLPPLVPLERPGEVAGESAKMLAWSFAEVHMLLRDVDAIDDDLRGYGARGAWQFGQGVFVKGGIDFYSDDEDVTRYDIGVGQSVPLDNTLCAFAALSWVWLELDGAGGSNFDENGWRFEGGFRVAVDKKIEGEVRLGYEDVADDGLVWGADVRYWFVAQAALGLGFEREVDDDQWTLGLRYAF